MTEPHPWADVEITADNFVDLLPPAGSPLPDPDAAEEPVGSSTDDLSDDEALSLAAEEADADDTTSDEAATWAVEPTPDDPDPGS